MSAIFCQYVGDYVFKQMIKLHCPIESTESIPASPAAPLTYEAANALRYAAGYVPRALKKALSKSAHPLKKDLQLCLLDLLDDGDEENSESKDWIELIDRGGLTHINDITFQLFQAMEQELRKHPRYQRSMIMSRVPWLKTRMFNSSGHSLVLTGRKPVRLYFSRWWSTNGLKSVASLMQVPGSNSTKLLKRKPRRNQRAFENNYFPDQKKHKWTVLKKP